MRVGRLAVCVVTILLGACRKPPAPAARSPEAGRPAPAAATPSSEPPKTAEGCRACNGDFGVHGLSETPFCNCRTHDAGKRCKGKDDCEAECIADGEREVTEPGPPPRGHHLGKCAEFRTTFGCNAFLPPHGPNPAPVRLDQPLEQLCVD
jgi:hypothetical protein